MRFTSAFLLALGSFSLHVTTTFAQLSSGQYYISGLNGKAYVGRASIEDASLLPKRIVVTPERSVWDVEALPNGKFILRNHGAPTAPIGDKVFAILINSEGEEWIIERQVLSGAYTIEQSDRKTGWTLNSDKPNTQVENTLLIVGPSLPPFYPYSELWKFEPVEKA